MKLKFKNQKAFSLVEVLVALTIFTVGVLGIMSLQGIAMVSTDFSGKMTLARILATDQIERLGVLPFTDASLADCGGTPFCFSDSGGGVPGGLANIDNMGNAAPRGRFRRVWDVQIINADVKQVTVRVFWTDAPGGTFNAPADSFNRSVQVSSTKVNPA